MGFLRVARSPIEAKLKTAGKKLRPFIQPAVTSRYRVSVNALCHALKEQEVGEIRELVRGLIERIALNSKKNACNL